MREARLVMAEGRTVAQSREFPYLQFAETSVDPY